MEKSDLNLEGDGEATQAPVPLVHVAGWVRSVGGVETLLARHAKADGPAGFDATQVALFDRPPQGGVPAPRYEPMRFSWRNTPRGMRRAMDHALGKMPGAITLWHNGWGLPWFASEDHSSRRIVCLWDGPSHFEPWLAQVQPWVDGVICMSESAAQEVERLLPDWPAERCQNIKVPMESPPDLRAARLAREEWVIGYAGRLVGPQKRSNRLVPFVKELRKLGVNYRVEVVSDGPMRPWLQQQLGEDQRVQFLGWQSSEEYWQRLQTWDAAVSFTDHEGGPIVLLETMAAGALPIFPAIGGCLADDYLPQLSVPCQYEPGNPAAAARILRDFTKLSVVECAQVRLEARQLAMTHTASGYDSTFADFAHRIATLPRVSRPPLGDRKTAWFERLPLGLVTRALKPKLWC